MPGYYTLILPQTARNQIQLANFVTRLRPQRGASFGSQAAPLLIYPAAGQIIYSTENSEEAVADS